MLGSITKRGHKKRKHKTVKATNKKRQQYLYTFCTYCIVCSPVSATRRQARNISFERKPNLRHTNMSVERLRSPVK